ncbi:hypothetical protein N431DRAFT_209908 [Stipitochalara longipes BDJ]|nr:hypothetical protein N431DRAFT_209908 [Stipitochalara longipes BDJ]
MVLDPQSPPENVFLCQYPFLVVAFAKSILFNRLDYKLGHHIARRLNQRDSGTETACPSSKFPGLSFNSFLSGGFLLRRLVNVFSLILQLVRYCTNTFVGTTVGALVGIIVSWPRLHSSC